MSTTTTTTISLEVSDASRQRRAFVSGPAESTVGELVNAVLARLSLPRTDAAGHAMNYRARLEREGRHLHASELVGDALRADDRITLQPDVNAG